MKKIRGYENIQNYATDIIEKINIENGIVLRMETMRLGYIGQKHIGDKVMMFRVDERYKYRIPHEIQCRYIDEYVALLNQVGIATTLKQY